MYVIRSTHSSRLKRFPSRSMRSSYRTSMWVKDEADIVSLFIQYRGPRPLDDRRRGAVGCAGRGRVQVDAPDDEGDRGTPPDRWPGTEATVPNGRNAERDDGSRLEGDGGARSTVRDQRRDRRGVGACCRTGVRGREVSPVIPSGRDSSPD